MVRFDLHPQRLARAEQLFLADDLIQRSRAHPFRQRLQRCRSLRLRQSRKQIHHSQSVLLFAPDFESGYQLRACREDNLGKVTRHSPLSSSFAETPRKTTPPPQPLHSATQFPSPSGCESARLQRAPLLPAIPPLHCQPAEPPAGTNPLPTAA